MTRSRLGLVVWLIVSLVAGFVGSRFAPGDWYESLAKPSWTPPHYVFGPVWTVLYLLMGVAAWLVWRERGFRGAGMPLGLFILQLALNAAWTYLFFGRHRPDLAFVEILVLWVLILITLVAFWRVRLAAGALLLPYLCWVGFAAALNHQLWRLNS